MHYNIGKIRRFLFIPGTWKWNGWVRDITARIEYRFFRSE